MTDTLIITETIQRTGYTVINGEKIVQHSCIIPADRPQDMRISMVKLNADLYRANRDICRADFAAFEDAAYQLQEEMLAKLAE